jgi:hypothetical protein
MNKPTHEEIALKAYSIWQERGSVHGNDTEIWLAAERALRDQPAEPTTKDIVITERIKAEASTPTTIKAPATPTIPSKELATAEVQKAEARAPQIPHHTAPVAKPAPPGKPIWDKPHGA